MLQERDLGWVLRTGRGGLLGQPREGILGGLLKDGGVSSPEQKLDASIRHATCSQPWPSICPTWGSPEGERLLDPSAAPCARAAECGLGTPDRRWRSSEGGALRLGDPTVG